MDDKGLEVITIAGNGTSGCIDGPAAQAQLFSPYGIAIAPDGAIYFSEYQGHRIKVLRNGQVQTIAGNGTGGYRDGPALTAQLSSPAGIALRSDGAILIADSHNGRVRILQNGQLTTFQAGLRNPSDVAIAPDGRIFIAEYSAHRIAQLNGDQLTPIVGTGTAGFSDGPPLHAHLNGPWGLALGPDGSLYISEAGNHRIRVLKNGELRTVAGNGNSGFSDGSALQAQLSFPRHIVCSEVGDVYIADQSNNRTRVLRKGELRTIAGKGSHSFADGPAMYSCFSQPSGLAIHPDGSLIVSEYSNHRLRSIPHAVPAFAPCSPLSLSKSIDKFTDMQFSSSSASLKLHRCLADQRFPTLKKPIPALQSANLDLQTLEAFCDFIYSEQLPKEAQPKVYLGLAFIFHKCNCARLALQCLKTLRTVSVGQPESVTVESLITLYCNALDLKEFEYGHRVARYLVLKHRKLVKASVVMSLMANQSPKFLEQLLDDFIDETPIEDPTLTMPVPAEDTGCVPLQKALKALFTSKADADFEIVINSATVVKCHRFVLNARWPFFATVFSSNMREANTQRYEMKNMHPKVLNALLEVCYTGLISDATRKELDPATAMQLLAAEMYFKTGTRVVDGTVAIDESFGELVAFAQQTVRAGINESNCMETFIAALEHNQQEVVSRAKEVMFQHRKTLFQTEKGRKLFATLPHEIVLELFFEISQC